MDLALLLVAAALGDALAVVRPFGDSPAAQPAVAVAPDGTVLVVAVRERRIWFTASTGPIPAGGGTLAWSPPVEVSHDVAVPGALRRGPRVGSARGSIVITAPTAGHGKDGGNLVAFRSVDRGKTWAGPVRVNEVPGSAAEGFHDLTATAEGDLFVAWLDGRGGPPGQEVWCARSQDYGATWSKNARAYASPDRTVCECCPISVAAGEGGAVGVVFRNWLGGARDPYLILSEDGGKTFGPAAKLGEETWRIGACPMKEGGVAFEGAQPVCLAGQEGKLELVRPGSRGERIGPGTHPAVIAGRDRVFYSFREGETGPLVVASVRAGEKAEPIRLEPPAEGVARDYPLFGSAPRGPVVLVFEERVGNNPSRAALVLLDAPRLR